MNKQQTKRRKIVMPIDKKLEIINKLENGVGATVLCREYGCGLRTIYDIRTHKQKIMQFVAELKSLNLSPSRKVMKTSKFPDLDKAVFQWFREKGKDGLPVTGPMIMDKALELHKAMNIVEPFFATQSWFHQFKQRHGIRKLSMPVPGQNPEFDLQLYEMQAKFNPSSPKDTKHGLDSIQDVNPNLTSNGVGNAYEINNTNSHESHEEKYSKTNSSINKIASTSDLSSNELTDTVLDNNLAEIKISTIESVTPSAFNNETEIAEPQGIIRPNSSYLHAELDFSLNQKYNQLMNILQLEQLPENWICVKCDEISLIKLSTGKNPIVQKSFMLEKNFQPVVAIHNVIMKLKNEMIPATLCHDSTVEDLISAIKELLICLGKYNICWGNPELDTVMPIGFTLEQALDKKMSAYYETNYYKTIPHKITIRSVNCSFLTVGSYCPECLELKIRFQLF